LDALERKAELARLPLTVEVVVGVVVDLVQASMR
jgi:hypothetical protein